MTAKEIFEANQVLTLEIAKTLIGKTISVTNPEYSANATIVRTGKVLSIESKWDLAAKEDIRNLNNGKFATRQDYWQSYMTASQIKNMRNTLQLISDPQLYCACEIDSPWYDEPTFSGSDSDRSIFYLEVLIATETVRMFHNNEVAIIEGNSYVRIPFENLSSDNKKRLKGSVGVIDERGKEHWFPAKCFKL